MQQRFGARAALGLLLAWPLMSAAMPGATGITRTAHAAEGDSRGAVRQVDLRPEFNHYNLTIKRQGARDTCHVFTVVAALEYAAALKYDRGVGLSEEYLNWASNQVTQEWRDGASFAELAQGLKRWGICEEQYMPYLPVYDPTYQPAPDAVNSAREIRKLNFRWHWIKAPGEPSDDAPAAGNTKIVSADRLRDEHIEAIKDVLRNGWPVCAGREHNVLIVGFRDDRRQAGSGVFIVRNSNYNGYRTMTYAETKAKSGAALWIDLALKERPAGDEADG